MGIVVQIISKITSRVFLLLRPCSSSIKTSGSVISLKFIKPKLVDSFFSSHSAGLFTIGRAYKIAVITKNTEINMVRKTKKNIISL
jgi:hypothetical protein